ncbi:hypothetical protein BDR22DRAFT_893174 [Usnea florida]
MSENESSLDVFTWLSQIDPTPTPFSDPLPLPLPSPTTTNRKRKRPDHGNLPNKYPRPNGTTTRPAFAQLQDHAITLPSGPITMSPKKRQNRLTPAEPLTPSTGSHKGSARSRSTASLPKLANNVHNVRRSLGDNGLYFQDTAYGDLFKDFKESIKALSEECDTGEFSYFKILKPLFIKDDRLVETKKRNFAEEIIYRSKAWADDGLDDKSDVPFVRGILFQDLQRTEAQLGLTNPKPDFTFGFKDPANPPRTTPRLSSANTTLIKMAESLRHPFFVVENKSTQDPIEEAENQAIRSGAALVEARRQLENNARPVGETENEGIDMNSFAFSCCWVPQYANIFVHWYELRKEEPPIDPFDGPTNEAAGNNDATEQSDTYSSIWHMNLVQGYSFGREEDMKEFRRDIDNILDWGVSPERKEALRVLELKLAAKSKAVR